MSFVPTKIASFWMRDTSGKQLYRSSVCAWFGHNPLHRKPLTTSTFRCSESCLCVDATYRQTPASCGARCCGSCVKSLKYLGTQVSWDGPRKTAVEDHNNERHTDYMKLQQLWRSRPNTCTEIKIFQFYFCVCPAVQPESLYPGTQRLETHRCMVS